MKLIKSTLLLTAIFASPLFANNIPINQIIVGNASLNRTPVLLTSLDSKLWGLPKIKNFPESAISYFTAINCNDDRSCFAVGSYTIIPTPNSGKTGGVLFLHSTDGGLNWAFKNVNSTTSSRINSISCQDEQYCVVSGEGGSFFNGWHPAVMESSDRGKTWSDVKGVPASGDSGNTAQASDCNSKACVVVGQYRKTSETIRHPLLFSTTNKGKIWKQHEVSNLSAGEELTSIALNKVTCNEKMCLATGIYSLNDIGIAIVLISDSLAEKWNKVINEDLSAWTNVSVIECNESRCLLLGNKKNKLAALYTNDYGKTWHEIANYNLPDNDHAQINSISCLDNHCVAVGDYTKDKISYPMIGTSEDDGENWTFAEEIDSRVVPSVYLQHVQCSVQSCVTFGRDKNGQFMLYSFDRGFHWSYSNAYPDSINENLSFTAQGSSKASVTG